MSDFDKSVRPQDDFFGYVNNNWIKNNPIPPDQSAWGNFYVLNDKSTLEVKKIIDKFIKLPVSSLSLNQIILKRFFETSINYSDYKINHISSINNEINKINQINSLSELSKYLGYAHSIGLDPFWQNIVDIDDKNSRSHVMRIQQSGISLPNRDYYLEKNRKMVLIRNKYKDYFDSVKQYIPTLKTLDWDLVYKIEYEIAKISWTDVKLRDVEKSYNKLPIRNLKKKFSNIDWSEYFIGLGWSSPTDNIVIDQLSFIEGVCNIISKFSINDIKQYLVWIFVNNMFSWIGNDSAKIKFNFYGKVLAGRLKNIPTWKRSIYLADDLMIGELIGREYVANNFPKSSKLIVSSLVDDIREAYHKRIDENKWLKQNSKEIAHKKLDNIRVFIGYPPTWHSFSDLKLSDDNQIINIIKANQFDTTFNLSKIGKEPEVEDWHIFSHVVNAYHDPNQLVICFPAAILKPPFFDPKSDYASNIGGIGAVIGHELTHGFDDQGSKFDEFGNVKDWQTQTEKREFSKLAQNIINQANSYEVLPGKTLKGKLIIGEAIADIGGIELAIEALKSKSTKKTLQSNLKKLFVNFAKCECGVQRDEYLLQLIKSDPHPVSKFRVNCVLPHVNDFYSTYHLTTNDKLYLPPEKRAHIW